VQVLYAERNKEVGKKKEEGIKTKKKRGREIKDKL
jgi:hypothetical protein